MLKSKDLHYLTLTEQAKLIKAKEISPVDLMGLYLDRIEKLEPNLNSFITVLKDEAFKKAEIAEEEILKGNYRGVLHGIPYGLKDLYFTKNVKTTFGSKLYDSFRPEYDSTIGSKLDQAGAILVGKTNTHPFAYGTTGENMEYGHMHNPWNEELIAGGSSGGSASAVSAGECTFAMGTDTGGSVRLPGALCGVVGLKATYGLLSRHGIASLSWSQDHPGPITRDVEDSALIMNAIANYDENDPNSVSVGETNYEKALNEDIRGMKIGVPKEFSDLPIDDEVKNAVQSAINKFEELGATIEEVSWPMLDKAMAIANTIQMSEATSHYSDLIKGYGTELFEPVRMRFETGFFVSSLDYIQAQRARVLYIKESFKMMEDVDVILSPTSPVPAFKIGMHEFDVAGKKENVVQLLSQYTRPFNLNGFPAISLPCGFSNNGLPIGLQIGGKPFDEKKIIQAAYAYEKSVNWKTMKPDLSQEQIL